MMNMQRRSDEATRRRRAHLLAKRQSSIVNRQFHRGFTLVEALIAITILLVIILFTGRIFSSASRVTTLGGANADAVAEATVIERQLREDLDRLSRDGFFVIQCTAVRNDINDPTRSGGSFGSDSRFWLDPNRAAGEYIRDDRMLFFMQGASAAQTLRVATNPNNAIGDNRKPLASASRVYWGHGYQLRDFALSKEDLAGTPLNSNQDYFPPWSIGVNGDGEIDLRQAGGSLDTIENFEAPIAPAWTLARQNILLVDDGGGLDVYLGQGASTATIWDIPIRDGRLPVPGGNPSTYTAGIDAAATQLNDIRDLILWDGAAVAPRQWSAQRLLMAMGDGTGNFPGALYYPRAERTSASKSRVDQALTVHTIGTGVSDFMIDWTYDNGTGAVPDPLNAGAFYRGIVIPSAGEKPWFGLPDDELPPEAARNVWTLSHGDGATFPWLVAPEGPIAPLAIEGLSVGDPVQGTGDPIVVSYLANFGYNQTRPLNDVPGDAGFGTPWHSTTPDTAQMYTPWPSALRITARLHDPENRLTGGRTVQFVIDLPRRGK